VKAVEVRHQPSEPPQQQLIEYWKSKTEGTTMPI
jgi:hypothetical protein